MTAASSFTCLRIVISDLLTQAVSGSKRRCLLHRGSSLIACLLLITMCAQLGPAQALSVLDGVTPAGAAPGVPAGSYGLSGFEHYNPFSGGFSASIPLYHVGGRGQAGFDLLWNLQQTWVAAKQVVGAGPYSIYIDPYPASYPQQTPPNAAGLGGPGALYARTSASFTGCGSPIRTWSVPPLPLLSS